MPGAKILILGGTSHFGRRFSEIMVASGQDVTCVTRGNQPVVSGAVHRICDRRGYKGISDILSSSEWDFVLDNLAFNRDDVASVYSDTDRNIRHLCVASSCAVYSRQESLLCENDVDLSYSSGAYADGKRSVEKFLQDDYQGTYASVRFPVILSDFDKTGRLVMHMDAIKRLAKMVGADDSNRLNFISSNLAADFIAHIYQNFLSGPYNAAFKSSIKYSDFVSILRTLVLSENLPPPLAQEDFVSPYSSAFDILMDISKAEQSGFNFPDIDPEVRAIVSGFKYSYE